MFLDSNNRQQSNQEFVGFFFGQSLEVLEMKSFSNGNYRKNYAKLIIVFCYLFVKSLSDRRNKYLRHRIYQINPQKSEC